MASNTLIEFRREPRGPIFAWALSAFVGKYPERIKNMHKHIEITDQSLDTKLTAEELAALVDVCRTHGFIIPDRYVTPVGEEPQIPDLTEDETDQTQSADPQGLVEPAQAEAQTAKPKRGRKPKNQ